MDERDEESVSKSQRGRFKEKGMERVGKIATFSIRPIANWPYCNLSIDSSCLCYNLLNKQVESPINS